MSAPFAWVKTVTDTLQEAKMIPLWGNPPPFPWEKASRTFGEIFGIEKLTIAHQKTENVNNPFAGFGKNPVAFPVQLTPLSETVYLIVSLSDLASFTKMALSPEKPPERGFSDPDFQKGFYTFLVVSAMDALNQMETFPGLSLSLGNGSAEGEGTAIDLTFNSLHARIFCPKAFRAQFSEHFAAYPFSLASSEMATSLEVELRLKAGSVVLSQKEWKEVKPGDFVRLHTASFDPEKNTGNLTIHLQNTSLFHASYKEGSLKILDYAFYQEEGVTMQDQNTEEPMWEAPAEGGEEQPPMPVSETPLVIHVEIGKLQMKLEKLLQLKPGNVLETGLRPELGVDLTVNGAVVAKAELIKIGDAFGLKILKLG